jgi:hypothetical protein
VLPSFQRISDAFERLLREKAFQTLVRGAIPQATLKRLLKDAIPRSEAREMPPEIWAGLAAGIAAANPSFGLVVAEELHDRLAWDREPGDMDEWWRLVRDRPLEALWMAAVSETRAVRREFPHIAEHCLDNHRSSPDCAPPSWEFIDGLLELQAQSARELREAEKAIEDSNRRYEAERARSDEIRDELKKLRRENSELRGEKAQAERRLEALESRSHDLPAAQEPRRVEDLERRLRKAEKEREHLWRELERQRGGGSAADPEPPVLVEEEPPVPLEGAPQPEAAPRRPLSEDPNPRRRVLRQMLRKLFKKGKIGASHTHEDNVYRGVADHEKGIAKEAIDLLYREGYFVPKPTATDPHVSLRPDRTGEIRAIIAGEIANPRLQRFVGE